MKDRPFSSRSRPLRPEELPSRIRHAFDFSSQRSMPMAGGSLQLHIKRTCLECDEEKWVITSHLRRSKSRASGQCTRCSSGAKLRGVTGAAHPSWRGGITFRNATIRSMRRAALKRGYVYALEVDLVTKLMAADCAYCGAAPSNTRLDPSYKGDSAPFVYNGIDRVDNKAGYTVENVVSCCFVCNRSKGEMSYGDWIAHLERVLDRA
jgi:hypothetical protein